MMDEQITNDFNPGHLKTTDELNKEQAKSAANGMGLMMLLGAAVTRTLLVFSRKPGTAGAYLVVAWGLGITIQGFWFHGHIENYGRIDATRFELLIAAQIAWWLVGLLITLWRMIRKRHAPERELGTGIFSRFFPHTTRHRAGLMSDLITGSLLAGLFHLLGSPVQCNWYLVMMGWIVIFYGVFYTQHTVYRMRANATRRRAQNWPNRVGGGHRL
ncbi:MAG: hypothetical protein AAGD11_06290 [Planctomycetota bacterium]